MLQLTVWITFLTSLVTLIFNHAEYFVNMGIMFAVTFVLKRLFIASNNKSTASLIALGGYSLTISIFFSLLAVVKADILSLVQSTF